MRSDGASDGTRLLPTLRWQGGADGHVVLIDQTRLPDAEIELVVRTPRDMIEAIRRLAIRGAPAIGVAGAYGVCLAARGLTEGSAIRAAVRAELPGLREARPTAINLAAMVDRMQASFESAEASALEGPALKEHLLAAAQRIHDEEVARCDAIGRTGAPLIQTGDRVLTHCNAGALATVGSGTALAVLYQAWRNGVRFSAIADETRPLLQGARLTAWELARAGIPVTVIADSAAAHLMARGEIDRVITGADRIVANGDTANKIGTYSVAALAARHGIPFYVAAPSTTFDFSIAAGAEIPIEERDGAEIWRAASQGSPPAGVSFRNPAFDVTPAELIAGWITEAGILTPPFGEIRK